MGSESPRARATRETGDRILDAARDLLGRDPDATLGEIAGVAGVVRRTVYGHFPTRGDLIRRLAARAADEMQAALASADRGQEADEVWAAFISGLWPVIDRYRVLLALRRGEFGTDIHELLEPIDDALTALVLRGQATRTFGQHLPAELLSQISLAAVFSIADSRLPHADAAAAMRTSLLTLGVSEGRAASLARREDPRPTEK